MGQAKQKAKEWLEKASPKKRRFIHLMRLISKYDDRAIERFAARRKL